METIQRIRRSLAQWRDIFTQFQASSLSATAFCKQQGIANGSGLRFDDTTPWTVVNLPAPELTGDQADQYEIIGFKDSARLAQLRSIFRVLIYRRPIVRHKGEQSVRVPAVPEAVLEGCYADVSLLAGLLVDKAVYHLPLYRQHWRMLNSGVQLSRSTLLNYMTRSIALLEPVYQAQWQSVLESPVTAMDEVPLKAGRKAPGKMKQTYFWPICSDRDEVVFTGLPVAAITTPSTSSAASAAACSATATTPMCARQSS